MKQQESGEVLVRERSVAHVQELPREPQKSEQSFRSSGNSGFTARSAEFDRRLSELRKRMVKDRAAAESELARLTRRCDVLKEFIFENGSAAENLENLNEIIHAEKEFSSRLEQLEIRYYRYYGKFSDRPEFVDSTAAPVQTGTVEGSKVSLHEALLIGGAVILAAVIIAVAIAAVFL